jgi:hypothetical protein
MDKVIIAAADHLHTFIATSHQYSREIDTDARNAAARLAAVYPSLTPSAPSSKVSSSSRGVLVISTLFVMDWCLHYRQYHRRQAARKRHERQLFDWLVKENR